MADIIPFQDRLRKQKEGALSKEKKQRSDSFRMVMQCTACPHKCAKCGSQLEVAQSTNRLRFLAPKTLPGLLGRIPPFSGIGLRPIPDSRPGILS